MASSTVRGRRRVHTARTGYLTCYQPKSLPKFVKKTPVFTANQLATETMDVIKPFVLCLPAARLP